MLVKTDVGYRAESRLPLCILSGSVTTNGLYGLAVVYENGQLCRTEELKKRRKHNGFQPEGSAGSRLFRSPGAFASIRVLKDARLKPHQKMRSRGCTPVACLPSCPQLRNL